MRCFLLAKFLVFCLIVFLIGLGRLDHRLGEAHGVGAYDVETSSVGEDI